MQDKRRRTASVRIRAGMTILAAAAATFTAFGPLHLAVVNVSPSMPSGLFVRTADPVGLSSIVEFCPPDSARLWLDHAGRSESHDQWAFGCANGATPFLKQVAAIAGDTVQVDRDGVHVNGRRALAGSRPLKAIYDPVTRTTRDLIAYPHATYKLKPSEVWAYTPLWSSLDSRYYGPVVPFATMTPLFVLPWHPQATPQQSATGDDKRNPKTVNRG